MPTASVTWGEWEEHLRKSRAMLQQIVADSPEPPQLVGPDDAGWFSVEAGMLPPAHATRDDPPREKQFLMVVEEKSRAVKTRYVTIGWYGRSCLSTRPELSWWKWEGPDEGSADTVKLAPRPGCRVTHWQPLPVMPEV